MAENVRPPQVARLLVALTATLAGGTRGVDVTITGKLVAAPRVPRRIVLPGGKAGEEADEDADRPAR